MMDERSILMKRVEIALAIITRSDKATAHHPLLVGMYRFCGVRAT
jgi:hypothetical protein